jgi:hypothetical protein
MTLGTWQQILFIDFDVSKSCSLTSTCTPGNESLSCKLWAISDRITG